MAESHSSDQYLNEIGRYRLLTPDEEISLGRRVQRMMQLKELDRPLTDKEKREVKAGERAMDRFVRSNLKLVVACAKKYVPAVKHMDLMDLIQEGNIGLIRGVEKFDPTRGYKFSTYAYWWIRQAMSRSISMKERTIRLPGKAQDLAMGWNKAMRELYHELGRTPTQKEIAAKFDVSAEELNLFLNRGLNSPISLDKVACESNDSSSALVELISDPDDPDGSEAMERAIYSEYADVLHVAYEFLDDKEKEIINRRWGLNGYEPESYMDISKRFHVSRERVRQLQENIQRKIRYRLTMTDTHTRKELSDSVKEARAMGLIT